MSVKRAAKSSAQIALEQRALKTMGTFAVRNKRLLVAVSGGRDSMVLLSLLLRYQRRFDYELSVAHVHHGPSRDRLQQKFRDQACSSVRGVCLKYGLRFLTNKNFPAPGEGGPLDESSLRRFRLSYFRRWMEEFDFLVLGHHARDVLETRLMRLIRGTGPFGLMAMSEQSERSLRPLLKWEPEDLEGWARWHEVSFCEDPSNASLGPFRNWIRHKWLPELEKKRPGALRALSRSLTLLAEGRTEALDPLLSVGRKGALSVQLLRDKFDFWTSVEKRTCVAMVLRAFSTESVSSSRVDEVLKRLQTQQKTSFAFRVAGLDWRVDTHAITVS